MNSKYSEVFNVLLASLKEIKKGSLKLDSLKVKIENRLQEFVYSTLILIIKDIISGSYMNFQFQLIEKKQFTVYNIDDLLEKLVELTSKIEELIYTDTDADKTSLISKLYYTYIEITKNSINKFGFLCDKLLKKHYNITKNFYKAEIFDDFISDESIKFKQEITLLNNIIELSKIDHNFIDSVDIQKSLFRLKNSFETLRFSKTEFTTLKNCALLKCNFLIYKWFKRFEKNYTSDSSEDLKTFQKWTEKIDYQYELVYNWNLLLIEKFKLNHKSNKYFHIHDNIKYFKDVQNNPNEIFKYYDFLSQNRSRGVQTLDSVSCNISIQYALNNYFSSICSTKSENILKKINSINISDKTAIANLFSNIEKDINEIFKIYEDCDSWQKEKLNLHNIENQYNYFIDYKLLNTIINIFQSLSTNFEYKYLLLNTFDKVFHNLGKRIKEYESKLKLSLLNNDNIFILPWLESKVSFIGYDIYFASSFLLPNKISSINNGLEEIKRDYNKLNLLLYLKTEVIEINNLKENYQNSNNKLMETLSIFTGIISFIVGSVSAYNFINTFNQALIFIILYGLTISIFVLLIFIGTRGVKSITDKWYIIFPYIFTSLILIYLLFNEFDKINISENKIENNSPK